MKVKQILKNVLKLRWRTIVALVFLTLALSAVKVLSPLLLRNAIDNIIMGTVHEANDLVLPTFLLALFSVLSYILKSLCSSRTIFLGSEITLELKASAYSSVLEADLLEINKLDSKKTLLTIEESTREIGNEYFANNIISFITNSIVLLTIVVVMFILNATMGAISLAGILLFVAISSALKLYSKKVNAKKETLALNHEDVINSSIESVKQLKIRNSLEKEEEAYRKVARKLEKVNRLSERIKNQNNSYVSELIVGLTFVAGIGAMGAFVATDNMTLGGMIAFISLIPTLFTSLHEVISLNPLPKAHKEAFENINQILNIRQENRFITVKELGDIYSLQFDNVSFEYGIENSFKLDGVSFEVRKGETLGILGLANSGKSTIIDIATKIIRPKQGKVMINNCDINKVDTYYLRSQISAVPQECKLLNGSIEHNIIHPLTMDEYKYNDALNKCHLKPLVNGLPKRDQTIIDNDTDLLTPTECQKIILANAFYKDSRIFLFDEATNKFDSTTEKEIMDEICKLKNKITIVVSNRIANLMKCTKVLIINNGKVIEYGNTEELVNNEKSTFARMIREYKNTKTRIG